jgi:galactose oxidase-like protein/Big-like domain-containing protein/Kelch motif protein
MKQGWICRAQAAAAVLLVAASMFIGIPRAAAAGIIVGDATIEPSTDTDPVGMAEAFQMTASGSGSVTTLNVYVDASSTAATLVAGLYADSGGHPGTLLTQGSVSTPTPGTWNAVSVPATTVTAGTTYWLALLGASGGNSLAFRDRCCGGGSAAVNSSQSNLTTLPGTWTNGARWSDGPASIYAGDTPPPPNPSQFGQWSAVMNWPLVALHAITMRNGNVLLMDGWQNPNQTQVFNPTTQAMTPSNNGFGLDIFCSGNVNMADGRVLVAGGEGSSMLGSPAATIFDPNSNTWTRVANMNIARWYPTATELGDGRILLISGQITQTTWADTPEIYDPAANTWTLLSKISTSQVHEQEYPLSYLLPSGKVFTIAPNVGQSFLLDPAAQTWSSIAGSTLMNGSAAQYLPGKILYSGGGAPFNSTNPAQASADIIDLTSSTPAWKPVAPMNYPRYTHTLTVLPDGKVLAIGGSANMSETDLSNAVMPAEEWDPSSNTWTTLASMQIPRIYHSTALLMPDGRVLVAGGGHESSVTDPGEYNGQFYSPPYLFNGARPTISSAPTSVTYGSSMTVQTPDAASIASVSLVSLGADTHTLDMDQHFVPLSFSAVSGGLTVSTPTASSVAPPGYYMLFIVNGSGVPSVASIVHIGPAADTTPPTVTMTAPANGATVSGSAVTVSAAATDNVAVSSVQFLLDGNPLGAPITQTPYSISWDSTSVANGSHTLSARATDPSGNPATASPITITVSNTAPTGITVDTTVSQDGRGPVSAAVSTSASGDLLVAFVGSDGPGLSPQTVTISGAGLTWTLVNRANSQAGDAEIWSARATGQLTGATVTAAQSAAGYDESLTVVAFKGATGIGAVANKSAASGAPAVTLTTTKAQSLIYGVGNDWDSATGRTLGTGQTLVHQWLDTATGDTFWLQRISALTGTAGSQVTINDTAPTGDRWNLSAVEVVGS